MKVPCLVCDGDGKAMRRMVVGFTPYSNVFIPELCTVCNGRGYFEFSEDK
jgi:hypothetical protein